MKKHYDILGLRKDATEKEINDAFWKLSSQSSPTITEENLRRINEAYNFLMFGDNRINYREEGNDIVHISEDKTEKISKLEKQCNDNFEIYLTALDNHHQANMKYIPAIFIRYFMIPAITIASLIEFANEEYAQGGIFTIMAVALSYLSFKRLPPKKQEVLQLKKETEIAKERYNLIQKKDITPLSLN